VQHGQQQLCASTPCSTAILDHAPSSSPHPWMHARMHARAHWNLHAEHDFARELLAIEHLRLHLLLQCLVEFGRPLLAPLLLLRRVGRDRVNGDAVGVSFLLHYELKKLGIESYHYLPSKNYIFEVPKTNGQLRVLIRHDDDGSHKGLFIHGFRPNSKAETQALLKIGDEILEIDNVNISGGQIEDLIEVLKLNTRDFVTLLVCRRDNLNNNFSNIE
jgi:hypothetical protein